MQHFFGNSELNNSVDEAFEKTLERDRAVLEQINLCCISLSIGSLYSEMMSMNHTV